MNKEELDTQEIKNCFKLNRGMKGTYGWEIKVLDDDMEKLKDRISDLDEWAKETFESGSVSDED